MGDLELGATIPEAAVKATIASCWPSNSPAPSWLKRRVAAELTAALPHIKRAVIQRLIEKAEAPVRFDVVGPAGYGHAQDARTAARWLRAELAEAGNGK